MAPKTITIKSCVISSGEVDPIMTKLIDNRTKDGNNSIQSRWIIRLIKPRSRPFINSNINLLIDKVNEQSFPSGHASFAFGLATVVYLCNKKWGIVFFISAILISIARVFAGVHWPSDILAGAVIGIFSGWLINKIFIKYVK